MIDSKDSQYHLILGSKGLENTENITSSDFFGFKEYKEANFQQQLGEFKDIAASVGIEQGREITTLTLTKEFLENPVQNAQFLRKLKAGLKTIP
ncbi:MAG: hypothetical protein LBD75_02345 [Candidatus Peribacteria bacterium]|nr:hypothetical protein [Candidatus Peribacteria bacterium]